MRKKPLLEAICGDVIDIEGCEVEWSRCSICPGKNRCVLGDGPREAKVMCIGEAPGREEDAGGRPFIGQAGREFNENYLQLAGLKRDEIYITNTVKCRPDLNRKPSNKEAVGCAGHFLPHELADINPEVVVLMGATACSLVGGIDLEVEHGIPRRGELYDWNGWIIPMFHPAAGLHDTAMMTPLLEDWEKLRRWLETGNWVWPVDRVKERKYILCETPQQLYDYGTQHGYEKRLMAVDRESHDGKLWSVQVSVKVGTGAMVLVDNSQMREFLVRVLNDLIRMGFVTLVFHNAPDDIDALLSIGVKEGFAFRDTMQEAYHFGNMGRQGLKALARRLLGRSRPGWEDVVGEPSRETLYLWMMNGFIHSEEQWQVRSPRFHKTSGKRLSDSVIKSEAERMLPELFRYSLNNSEYDIWKKLYERVSGEEIARLTSAVGPVPVKGIAYCKLEDAVHYGCSDADDTLALALLFDRMRKEFIEKLNVQEED